MSKLAIDYVAHHKNIFESIMDYYTEVKKSHGSIPSRDYEVAAENGPPDEGRCTRLVSPNLSDFLCDVELAAKRALSTTPHLYAQFQAAFVDQVISVDVISREDLAIITEQVARMLVTRRIYPFVSYLSPKDLR